jgi:VWFA-related protein
MWCRRRLAGWCLAGWLGLCAASLCGVRLLAQPAPSSDAPVPTDALPMTTLHVYMDLIQVPVLVLDSDQGRMKPIDPKRFEVSLDSGPEFRPKHARQEGDDPITLGILLDLNSEADLATHMDKAIAALAPRSLSPKDHVTIFGLDCGLTQTMDDRPADSAALQLAVERAIAPWSARRKTRQRCAQSIKLWDSMAYAVKKLGDLPGRRVLLAVTSGQDGGSTTKWNELRQYAQLKGVAIFGFSSRRYLGAGGSLMMPLGGRGRMLAGVLAQGDADPLDAICELSGGRLIKANWDFVGLELPRFVTEVRERYILEFTRPRNDAPGMHGIEVSVKGDGYAYVRPAGVTILGRDASLSDDPTVIKRDQTDAPEMGTRKPLTGH